MLKKKYDLSEIDRQIGDRICNMRVSMGLSRQQLASIIGVTHQQIHKYEKGINRISAGSIAVLANSLGTEIAEFYQDLEGSPPNKVSRKQRMCIEVARNFMKIESEKHQCIVSSLVKSLVYDDKD